MKNEMLNQNMIMLIEVVSATKLFNFKQLRDLQNIKTAILNESKSMVEAQKTFARNCGATVTDEKIEFPKDKDGNVISENITLYNKDIEKYLKEDTKFKVKVEIAKEKIELIENAIAESELSSASVVEYWDEFLEEFVIVVGKKGVSND